MNLLEIIKHLKIIKTLERKKIEIINTHSLYNIKYIPKYNEGKEVQLTIIDQEIFLFFIQKLSNLSTKSTFSVFCVYRIDLKIFRYGPHLFLKTTLFLFIIFSTRYLLYNSLLNN